MENARSLHTGSGDRGPGWGAGLLFLFALAMRVIHIGHTPVYDEFYHVLAARSWLEHHTLSISGGTYTRAAPFTILVALCYRLFGESLVVARLPALLAGALLIPAVFLWVRSVGGTYAAWTAGVLTAVSPTLIDLSQIVRFYTLQSLCVFLGAIAVYALVLRRVRGWRAAMVAFGGVAVLAFGLILQVTTAIAAAALITWAAAVGLCTLPTLGPRWRKAIPIALLSVAVLALGAGWAARSDLGRLWHTFRVPPYWEAGMATNHRYYFYWFMDQYPTLWSLFPLAALWAAVRCPAPALFAGTVFAIAVIVHSIAGPKAERYIAYTLPFFFIVWGIAIGELLPALSGLVREGARMQWRSIRPIHERWLTWAALIAIFGFMAVANPAFPLTYRLLTRSDADWVGGSGYRGHANWAAAVPTLTPWVKGSAVVLTSSALKALYYFGRYDFEINASNLRETESKHEFSVDPRTGHPVVGDAEAVRRILACYPSGVVIADARRWEHSPRIVPAAVAAVIEARTHPIPIPGRTRVVAFEWRHAQRSSGKCSGLP